MTPQQAIEVADWRERVHALYSEVRADVDHERSWERWRQGRDGLLGTHPASPVQEAERGRFTGLALPAYDPAWRFEAALEAAATMRLEVATGSDGVVPFERIGLVRLPFGTLDVWWLDSYGGGLFIPVKDASAGRDGGTYGGGRYLVDTVKGADLGRRDGLLVLDLNFAYNPSCAYDEAWACPLAPAGNTVGIAIPVGERAYAPQTG